MNTLIKESPRAMASVVSVLEHAGIDHHTMTTDEMIDKSRGLSAPCAHNFDRPYRGRGTRECTKCGGLQDN